MYLRHHYAVDLVGGSLRKCAPSVIVVRELIYCSVAGIVFYTAKAKFLPRQQPDKMFRWDYDFAEVGEDPADKGYASAALQGGPHADADEWTIGSSSSISSGSRSPEDDQQSLWEGQTLASHSDTEALR